MKITILQGAFFPVPPILGGAVEKMWFRLGQEFASKGHRVTHLSRHHGSLAVEEEIAGVRHVRIRGYDQPRSALQLKLFDFLYSRRACRVVPADSDIVVTNTFWSPLLLPRSLRGRAYIDVARMPRGQCRLYAQAGRLRANSTPVAEAIRRELPAAQHGRISLIPNPLPFDPPAPIDAKSKKKVVLYCGRVHPEKGLDLLIKAASGLPPDWTVRIIGPWETSQGGGGKEYLDNLRRLAQGMPVTFHDPEYNMERLAEHYREAAIFAYPSVAEKGETFGLAPLEAMAWGCVPVVSDLGCFKDFVQHARNGVSFDHRSANAAGELRGALGRLMEDQELRSRLSMEAVKVCQTHSPEHIAQLFLADFQAIIDMDGAVPAVPSIPEVNSRSQSSLSLWMAQHAHQASARRQLPMAGM